MPPTSTKAFDHVCVYYINKSAMSVRYVPLFFMYVFPSLVYLSVLFYFPFIAHITPTTFSFLSLSCIHMNTPNCTSLDAAKEAKSTSSSPSSSQIAKYMMCEKMWQKLLCYEAVPEHHASLPFLYASTLAFFGFSLFSCYQILH